MQVRLEVRLERLGHPAGSIGSRTIHFGVVLPRKGSASMGTPATVNTLSDVGGLLLQSHQHVAEASTPLLGSSLRRGDVQMAAIKASGAVTPPPGDTGLRGLRGWLAGDTTGSGQTSRSFFEAAQGERLQDRHSLERGQRLRPCREGRGLVERAETAGLRLRR
ncbi:hypothetical protein EYF80_018395 [Liparis tanakae]|uniref:Uncharacterized protein n=1 Tax=Liparis tanakae TaxID=230148 RepID=A0A4Z2I033_9TELE|nr:hypothetical protein EYF80_018395 [Liparis tanakae]